MSLRLLRLGLSSTRPRPSLRIPTNRLLHSSTRPTNAPPRFTRKFFFASGTALATSIFLTHSQGPVYADSAAEDKDGSSSKRPTPLSSLVRSYIVYTACSLPGLVDWSPTILATFMSVPGLKQITEAIVRITFFDQFVGGDTAHATLPVLKNLRAENKGCLFAYSVEVDESEAEGNAKVQKEPVHKRIVQEMIRCIDVAADFEDGYSKDKGRRTWVALKLTALLPNASSLMTLSKHIMNTRAELPEPVAFPGKPRPSDLDVLYSRSTRISPLTQEEIEELRELHKDLNKICTRAQERGVKIIIDAEHSWYQPAIDAFGLSLMRQFNKPSNSKDSAAIQPLVYVTFQAYLRRNKSYLFQSLADAKAEGWALGVKLVRGAYHPHELKAHESRSNPKSHSLSISPDDLPPVWATKPDTDACYNECVQILLDEVVKDVRVETRAGSSSPFSGFFSAEIPPAELKSRRVNVGVLFGSHNWTSVRLILDSLVDKRLANVVGLHDGEAVIEVPDEVAERVTMAQLYGMCDALTNYIVDRTRSSSPLVLKYVPYGALVEVLPYLSRRAIENKSVLGGGGAAAERKVAAAGIWARVFG